MNEQKKKVLLVAYNGLNKSGVPFVITNIINALSDNYDFSIMTFSEENDYLNFLSNNIVKLLNYNEQKPNTFLGKLIYHFFLKKQRLYKYCLSLFKNANYDIIHSFKESDSYPIFKAAKKTNINKRIFHCNVIHKFDGNFILSMLKRYNIRKTLQYSTDLVGVTQLACDCAFGKRKSLVIYNPVAKPNIVSRVSNDSFILLQIGSIEPNKNQLFTIKVFIELLKMGTSCELFFVGKVNSAEYHSELSKVINNYNLETKVHIVGSVSDTSQYYNRCNLVILPSIMEGASLVAVEAQSYRKKIILSNTISNEIDLGGCIFCDLKSGPLSWAKAIYNSIESNQLEDANYDFSKFSLDNFGKNISELYEK